MHPVSAIMNWSHHMRESMHSLRSSITEHLQSRHFWIGAAVTLLVLGFLTLIYMVLVYGSMEFNYNRYPIYSPYGF